MSEIRINKLQQLQQQKLEKKEAEEKKEQLQEQKQVEVNHKNAGEVLEFMAQSGALNKAQVQKKPVDTAKHVDAESQARIEKMMKAFDETILKSAEVAIQEFGLSEAQGQDVAIMAFNQKFLA